MEIIKLNGSIELAPIVGLSEVICDIVETGSTLRENGLHVLEEVCPLSARVVVNQVSMKMESERISELLGKLKTGHQGGRQMRMRKINKRNHKKYSGKHVKEKPEPVRRVRKPGTVDHCRTSRKTETKPCFPIRNSLTRQTSMLPM